MRDETYPSLLKALQPYAQEHLLQFWDHLTGPQQDQLANQIREIDFAEVQRLFAGEESQEDWGALAARSSSPRAIRLGRTDNRFTSAQAIARGQQMLADGEVGVLLVAGGQGSRLGFDQPKGMFPIGPISDRTLFQMHVDRQLAVGKRYGRSIPLYLMTSPATHDDTVQYFRDNDNLGLDRSQLHIFCQGTMPAVDIETGRLLMSDRHQLFLSPDGHGGTLGALAKSGLLKQMEKDGIRHLFYYQVDNPLVDVAAPKLLGFHRLAESEMTTQVVCKQDPLERVGNVVSVDGHLLIIEYSDLPDEAAGRRNSDGSLTLWAGSIAVHVFDVGFLRRIADQSDSLPFHEARKKVSYLSSDGQYIEPETVNAIKFERFIFDLLPFAANALVVEVDPADGFAPLKNAAGSAADTAEHVQNAILSQHARWIESAGGKIAEGVRVEIHPDVALDEDELKTKIKPGLTIAQDHYWTDASL